MGELVPLFTKLLPASTDGAVRKIQELTAAINEKLVPYRYITEHLLHGGMYTRTLRLPPGIVAAAVLVKPPTVLVGVGTMAVWSNDTVTEIFGYNVLAGSAGRKIALVTHSEIAFTMVFPCRCRSVEEAEREFTDEHELLAPLSELDRHRILITGE